MRYITGMHALNIPSNIGTSGDWHRGCLNWDKPTVRESEGSTLGDWGIYKRDGEYIANHLRAVLDLFETNELVYLDTFKSDYISTSKYDDILREKFALLETTDEAKELFNRLMWKPKYSLEELRASGKLRKRR